MRNEFRVPCSTGTYADVLLALGLARLLRALEVEEVNIRRESNQNGFCIQSKSDVPNTQAIAGKRIFSRIITKGQPSTSPDDVDYEAEKAKRARFFEWKKANPKAKITDLPEGALPEPRPDYSLISSLIDLLKPINVSAYSRVADLLTKHFGVYSEGALQAFSTLSGNPEDTEAWLKKAFGKEKTDLTVSAVQIFNPMSGKGMNAAKPNSIGMGGLESPVSFEMLKMSGWWLGAVAATPRKSKDLKVLVATPQDILDTHLEAVMQDFRTSFYGGGAVQIDVLAALRLSEVLLDHHAQVLTRRGRPRHVVAGFSTAYFQNLGTSKGVSNISFIALPEWVNVQDDADRILWLSVLEEHRKILSRLDESRSEAHSLLELYRDFLSGNDLMQFLDFLVDYGAYALGLADRNKPIQWFSTTLLWRVWISMNDQLSTILENPGFQNVAAAIRRSTRGALYAKKLGNDRTFEVRYGLAQELKRKALYKSEFAAALSEFVAEYMTENLRAADRNKRQRPSVTTEDLAHVFALLDNKELGHQTVAMMLIAYGYAKEPTEPKESDDNTDESNAQGDDDQ